MNFLILAPNYGSQTSSNGCLDRERSHVICCDRSKILQPCQGHRKIQEITSEGSATGSQYARTAVQAGAVLSSRMERDASARRTYATSSVVVWSTFGCGRAGRPPVPKVLLVPPFLARTNDETHERIRRSHEDEAIGWQTGLGSGYR
jgi:hypothetical protein